MSPSDTKSLRFFCRHLIALCLTFRFKTDQEGSADRFMAYPGTLVRIHGRIFLLTAGHNLKAVKDALESENVVISQMQLADTFGLGKFCDPIPFTLKSSEIFFVDNDYEGLDFGVIQLGQYFVQQLAANGMVALGEENWKHQKNVKFDGYAMLGFPVEYSSEHISSDGNGLVSPTMFGVCRLEVAPAGVPTTGYNFIGQLDSRLKLKSPKGMSGGPIFGFRLGAQTAYWVVALQSSWHAKQRIVFGCSLPTLGDLMSDWASKESA